jgi:epoxyqueuosine reductase
MKSAIKLLAKEQGFDDCRFARADAAPHAEAYFSWLQQGAHGDMEWLSRDPARRSDPGRVLAGARSLIVLAKNYFQGPNARPIPGKIARYAWGDDYHQLIRNRMTAIDSFLASCGGTQKCYVDTGPILERDFAARSGLSWQGKSTMCLNEKLGTWFFLAVILTTLEIEPDDSAKNRCGKCTRCIDVCPTGAITAPYQLDARRCISYLTIENKGAIPVEFRSAIGDRIYGCDDCLDACPWNRFAQRTREDSFQLTEPLRNLSLRELAGLGEAEFRALFRSSPIKRLKRPRFVRNICVALGNVGTEIDLPVLERLSKDTDPMIAEHADWAVEEVRRRVALSQRDNKTQPGMSPPRRENPW